MNKWYGIIGYVEDVEDEPGIWVQKATEKRYFGDILKNSSRWSASNNSLNDNRIVDSQISIVTDPYAFQHFSSIKYVEFMGTVWEVSSIKPEYPRLIISMGGLWNGEREQAESAEEAGGASGD